MSDLKPVKTKGELRKFLDEYNAGDFDQQLRLLASKMSIHPGRPIRPFVLLEEPGDDDYPKPIELLRLYDIPVSCCSTASRLELAARAERAGKKENYHLLPKLEGKNYSAVRSTIVHPR